MRFKKLPNFIFLFSQINKLLEINAGLIQRATDTETIIFVANWSNQMFSCRLFLQLWFANIIEQPRHQAQRIGLPDDPILLSTRLIFSLGSMPLVHFCILCYPQSRLN